MAGSVTLEFDDDGNVSVKQLRGDLPEETRRHIQTSLGWSE